MIVLKYDKINIRRHEIIKEVVSTDQELELEQFLFFFSLCEIKKKKGEMDAQSSWQGE